MKQKLIAATVIGESATAVVTLFHAWAKVIDQVAVDRFCDALRHNGTSLPVVYYCEWVDRWLMGDLVPGPRAVMGQRYEAACLSPQEALAWAEQCGDQWQEQTWLAARLREATAGWGTTTDQYAIVIVREVLDVSTTDEEVQASVGVIPDWLSAFHRTGQ
ncbi:MAG: hypothetical protein EXR98_09805 [Gemmataceae bacterium]|nr:hypothetical protein [Gemmataceae bacterium]